MKLNRRILRRVTPASAGGALTDSQRWFLQYGHRLMNGQQFPFAGVAEARQVWRIHSASLLAESRPGARPYGFWRYDLEFSIEPDFWRGLGILIERCLVDTIEAGRLEHDHRELSEDPGAYLRNYDSADSMRLSLRLMRGACSLDTSHDPTFLSEIIETFGVAAMFHTWRNRPAVSELWRNRAEVAQSLLDADPAMSAEARIREERRQAFERRRLQESGRR